MKEQIFSGGGGDAHGRLSLRGSEDAAVCVCVCACVCVCVCV